MLQHKDNPVDWWEWGDAAFAEAKRRDTPVLLSIGYAACHWCHVMAHESFEDVETATQMNAGYVNVKVDREERPDVDAVYMSATQALTGHGGWPMTVFLTAEGLPFYAGTYFPATPRHGLPSFRQLLTAISEIWQDRRGDAETAGARIASALAEQGVADRGPGSAGAPSLAALSAAVERLAGVEDQVHGGFGSAPKFPPSMVLEFLLRFAAAGAPVGGSAADDGAGAAGGAGGAEVALGVASRTLRAMAHSGMYDQLAGGFARYSVDRAWVVPHFEKMLYDNAQLARVYLHWWRLTGEPAGARIALETCDWMLAGLGTPEGGLASSLDADTPVPSDGGGTHGVEGLTYVWTPAELAEVLGPEDGAWAAELLRVTPAGTFEHGSSTLQLARDVWAEHAAAEHAAAEHAGAEHAEAERWVGARARLLAVRESRPQPARDDKVVAAWNGLAIAALAEAGALLNRPDLVAAAVRTAQLLLEVHWVGGRLRRVSRDGVAGAPGAVLEDYGDLAEGLLTLHSVTGEARWLTAAGDLLDVVLAEFFDGDAVFDTPADGTDAALAAVGRPSDPTDNAYPSGTSAAAGALLSYAALTGSARHRLAAEAALGAAASADPRAAQAFGSAFAVAVALHDGPREVAVVGEDGDPGRAALHAVALASTAPGLVVSVGVPDLKGVPLLADRPLPNGRPAAYVCRNFTCELPTADATALAGQLSRGRPRPKYSPDLPH